MRTIEVWLLLRRLHKVCEDGRAKHLDHYEKHGHHYGTAVVEQQFLREVAGKNDKKRAHCIELLTYADKKLGLVKFIDDEKTCTKCDDTSKVRWIRLNDEGFEFIGFLEFLEFMGKKYPIGWGMIVKLTAFATAALTASATGTYFIIKFIYC